MSTIEALPEAVSVAEDDVAIIFDRAGRPLAGVPAPEIVIEPEHFLAETSQLSVAQRLRFWLAEHAHQPALGIRFPKFTDGRGFSLAARLREAGYAGELHALGAISQDLIFQLRRVGFTHFHLVNPGVEVIAPEVVEPFGAYYQAGADGSLAHWQRA